MDTLIFVAILATLIAMIRGQRWLSMGGFFLSLVAALLLFGSHLTASLNLRF